MSKLQSSFITTPICTVDVIAIDKNGREYPRTLKEGEPAGQDELLIAGKRHWDNVLIKNIDNPIGEKFETLLIDRWKLHGITPIYKQGDVTLCIYDYAEIIP